MTRPLSARALALALLLSAVPACQRRQPESAAGAGASKHLPQLRAGAFNVAFVYVGPVGDGGWTYAHDLGRKQLEQKLGVHTVYIESVAEGAEAEQVLRALARKGFDLIVATSFGYMDAVEAAAREFPKSKFVHISGHKSNATNFGNLFGAMECMKYLAGMIAGARAAADGKTKLGYIAPYPIPEVVRLGNAIVLGARETCPACTMEIRWINSWFDPTREREAADSLLKAGAHVVITGADTPGPIVAAKDAGRWAIGYDSLNACQVAPERCLTTPYWDWGPVYVELVKRIRAGSWRGGSEYLDVASGIVGLFGFMPGQRPQPGVPAEVVPRVRALLAKMQAGQHTRFDVFAGPLVDNAGKERLAAGARLEQRDLEGLGGCRVCMSWLARGIVGALPAKR
jgi:basic membrane protein A